MHNGWYDVGCYLEFVRGHPYADERLFLAQFTKGKVSGLRKRPSPAAVRLFQRMFMASTIIRPADCVTLPACRKIAFKLDLSPQRAMQVAQLTENYKKTSKLGYAIQAQLYQLHWGLILEKEDEHHPEQDLGTTAGGESNDENTVPNDCTSKKTDGRAQWIKELANWPLAKLHDSDHLLTIVDLNSTATDNSARVVVFSQYLRYLNLIDTLLRDRSIPPFATTARYRLPSSLTSRLNSRLRRARYPC